ncbi:MAG TPA: hypothetical protein VFF65_02085 [Phycisphaerales bacterium]|nr:hypothetical protein [Phycisphaerales bacterium]
MTTPAAASFTPNSSVRVPLRYFLGTLATIVVVTGGSVWGVAAFLQAGQEKQAARDREQDDRARAQEQRIAAVESWRSTTQSGLDKIDERFDRLFEKVNSVAETVGRIDERTKRP